MRYASDVNALTETRESVKEAVSVLGRLSRNDTWDHAFDQAQMVLEYARDHLDYALAALEGDDESPEVTPNYVT